MHNTKFNKEIIIFVSLLFLFGFSCRLIEYPPNFTPIAAIALFSGFYLRKKYIIFLPLAIMFFSDLFLGLYQWQIMASVYISISLVGIIGLFVNRKKYMKRALFGSILGSCLFFVITNFAVWYFGFWYVKDLYGLLECYYMAIPFFRNTLLGDLFFTGLIFSAYQLYSVDIKKLSIINSGEYAKK